MSGVTLRAAVAMVTIQQRHRQRRRASRQAKFERARKRHSWQRQLGLAASLHAVRREAEEWLTGISAGNFSRDFSERMTSIHSLKPIRNYKTSNKSSQVSVGKPNNLTQSHQPM